MTESHTDHKVERAELDSTQSASESASASGHSVYSYQTAGISEHQGSVPLWLWIVVFSLLIWGFYYLVTYWNAPIVPT